MKIKNKSLICFWSVAFLFLILKIIEMQFKFSDGFTYMYMGKLILNGLTPYRDFFFASPPLQVYIIAFFEIFTGKNILLLKLIPIFASIGGAFFIYSFVKSKFDEWQGLVASILFLFSFLVLLTTDYSTGISLTLFFIFGSIYFIEKDKPFLAGIFASLALLTRLYAPFPVAGIFLYLLIYKRKSALKFLLGTLALFIPISIFFQIISNGGYLDQIFLFRLNLISGIGLSKWNIVKFFIIGDFILVLGSLFYFLFDKEKKKLLLPVFATIFSLILYLVYSDVYYLYFGLIIGFLAIFTSKFIFKFSSEKNFKKFLVIFLALFILFNSSIYIANYASASNVPFSNEITNFVRENSEINETIYGSFEITPMVAILSERSLAGNIADTNPKNIITSEFTMKEIEEKISGVRFIIAKGIQLYDGTLTGFDASTPIDYINQNCILAKTYSVKKDLNGANIVLVYDCKKPNFS
ncbi:MAG: glycosyltransferase family 39 protein [Nanoarchaeota archaeon]|nr:glycosyltransferase family 39 protein [Nanoarchaeota archaeon]